MAKDNGASVENIFSDKIKLTRTIISFELEMIQEFNSIVRRLSLGEISENDLSREDLYYSAWQQMMQLYDFIEYDHSMLDKVETVSWYKEFSTIIETYRVTNKIPKIKEFKLVYRKLRYMMFLSGYHDVSTNKAPVRDFLKPTQAWD